MSVEQGRTDRCGSSFVSSRPFLSRCRHRPISYSGLIRRKRRVIDSTELLKDLTDPQREAATHTDGPLLIIAGAGSGKTRVITRRVAYLMSQGIPGTSILGITFTNKAAGELKDRVGKLMERPIRDFGKLDQRWPILSTFHSLCLRILRHYASVIGLPSNFAIYDSGDQSKVVKEALKALDMSSNNFPPAQVHHAISAAKNKLISAEQFAGNSHDFYNKQVARIYIKYQQLLKQNNALDFDDLLMSATRAFRDHPQVLAELQERFQYILIDEYQDTNHAQYILAHALAQKRRNICVVGDPDQSIYAWRGADIRNILEFERDYPDAKVVKLEQNYRSTKTILAIASKLIANNSQRKDKSLWTENVQGEHAKLVLCQDEHDEALVVSAGLKELHDAKGADWNGMAIFYRMNALSRVMEDALRKAGIPYVMARGVEFYNRKEIKDVLAYLRVISNPDDEINLERVVNVPARGIGDSAVKQMQTFAVSHSISLWGAMGQVGRVPGLSTRAVKSVQQFVYLVDKWRELMRAGVRPHGTPATGELHESGVDIERSGSDPSQDAKGGAIDDSIPDDFLPGIVASHASVDANGKASESFRETVIADDESFQETAVPFEFDVSVGEASSDDIDPAAERDIDVENEPPSHLVRRLIETVLRSSGYEAHLKKFDKDREEGERASDNVAELVSAAAEFDEANPRGTLEDYLAQVSLVSDADHMKGNGGAVTMMTLHAAKGLEFPVVAMIGMEEGILPHSRARDSQEKAQMEEERRLCFVGITRAQERLLLTRAAHRTIRGMRERTVSSPFLGEMPQEYLDIIDRTGVPGMERDDEIRLKQRDEQSRLSTQFRRGQMVRHPTFGIGRITDVSDMGAQTRAVIDFTAAGRKTLILQYARLEAVG